MMLRPEKNSNTLFPTHLPDNVHLWKCTFVEMQQRINASQTYDVVGNWF